MSGDSLETPDADVAEQQAEATPGPAVRTRLGLPLEADPADAADQAREVALDEDDDYR